MEGLLELRLSDGFITLSPWTIPLVRDAYAGLRQKPGRSILHGHYLESYPQRLPRQAARTQLGISPNARVLRDVRRSRQALLFFYIDVSLLSDCEFHLKGEPGFNSGKPSPDEITIFHVTFF